MARPQKITDAEIISAMRMAVLEHGAQVSLEVVAETLGVTAPAIIKRFRTRQNLLLSALQPDKDALVAIFACEVTDDPFHVQLESLIERLSDYFRTTLPGAMALRSCGIREEFLDKKPLLLSAIDGATRWLDSVRRRGLIGGGCSSATAATAIVGAVSTRMLSAYMKRRTWSQASQSAHEKELALLFTRALEDGPTAPKRGRKSSAGGRSEPAESSSKVHRSGEPTGNASRSSERAGSNTRMGAAAASPSREVFGHRLSREETKNSKGRKS